MLRAARAVVDHAGRLPLRIGVNLGNVFSGDFGPSFRRTYSVKGDAINLAARVMGRAEPGRGARHRSRRSSSSPTRFDPTAARAVHCQGQGASRSSAVDVGPVRRRPSAGAAPRARWWAGTGS